MPLRFKILTGLPFFVWFLFLSGQLFPQEAPIELKEVDKANLEMQYYDKDSTADALILSDYGYSHFQTGNRPGLQLAFEQHLRKKIFNKKGFDEAEISIPLYQGGGAREDLDHLRAYTYNLVNDKIVRTKVKKKHIYNDKISDHLEYVRFTFPEVKAGSIIEVKYTITSDFQYNLRSWKFQHDIPVKRSEYVVEIPEFFRYHKHTYGFQPYKIHERDTIYDFISATQHVQRGGQYHTSTGERKIMIDFKKYTDRWVAEDLPAFKKEPFSKCPDNYMNRIEFELSSVNFPNTPPVFYAESWESIKDKLYANSYWGGQLKRLNSYLNEPMEKIGHAAENSVEKMQAIFRYIKNRISWNEYTSNMASKSLRQVWKDKTGNSADINLLLTVALRKAGLQANPVILSTRKNGLIHPAHPSISQTNHIVVCAVVNNKEYLMDASDPHARINMLPIRCLNGKGRLLAENGTREIELQTNIPFKKNNFGIIQITNDHIKANIRSVRHDYAAYKFRNQYESFNTPEEYIQQVEQDNQLAVGNWSISNPDTINERVIINLDSVSSSQVNYAGDRIYFNPIIYDRQKENPFKVKERNYPVDYAHPHHHIYNYQVKIPEGYGIESLPESEIIRMPHNDAQFMYSAKKIGDKVMVTNIFAINKPIFLEKEYPDLVEFYDDVIARQSQQIVFKKKEI